MHRIPLSVPSAGLSVAACADVFASQEANIGYAACAQPLTPGAEVQLLPAGEFRASDGRPKDAPRWYVDAALAGAIIQELDARTNDLVLDYEHATMLAAEQGTPAPAAGWFKKLQWREGKGLYATDVRWTPRAAAMIEGGEYRYISPVFAYDKKTGAVRAILNAAITNSPAIDGMDAVLMRAAARRSTTLEETDMQLNELLAALRKALHLDDKADADAVVTAATVACTALTEKDTEIAALSAKVKAASEPDPAKYVPVEAMKSLQDQFAALRAEITGRDVDGLVVAALTDGRLMPVQEKWARDLGGKDIAALRTYIETAQPIAALSGTQTGGKSPAKDKDGLPVLDADQIAMCRSMGVSQEDFRKTLAAQA